ncbi:hypothetical protein BROUX41_003887 [Berkeleyomyces rouxiae]|uniref:uncharacterized protein n=1 Tax=Berkeleyomyces rouxiae TaxID=2035830 RepID=UPI003B7EF2B5
MHRTIFQSLAAGSLRLRATATRAPGSCVRAGVASVSPTRFFTDDSSPQDDRNGWGSKTQQPRQPRNQHRDRRPKTERSPRAARRPARDDEQRRPAFAQPYFFQYKTALERIGRCLKWGCSEEELGLASFIVRNLVWNWHTNCAAAFASFRVPGAQIMRVNPTTSSLTRAGVVPVNQLFQNLTGDDESFYLKHHEVNVRKHSERKARSGEKIISFTSFKIHRPDGELPAVHISFATHMFYQSTRELAATVQVHSKVMAPEEELPRIRHIFEEQARNNVEVVTKGRKFCFILEKDLRRLEEQTWNRAGAVEDLGSAAGTGNTA